MGTLAPGFRANGSVHGSSAAVLSHVSASQTIQTILTASPDRVSAFVYNATPANAFVCFGVTGSVSSWTNKIPPSGSWAFPAPVYAGPVVVFFDATGTGSLMVTETHSPGSF